jgi:hypothetical protein
LPRSYGTGRASTVARTTPLRVAGADTTASQDRSSSLGVLALVVALGLGAVRPVVFGSGRPFFATGGMAEPLRLENPTRIVPGDRVIHLVYDVCTGSADA